MGLRRIAFVLAAGLALTGCRVDATVTVTVNRDGSGTVAMRAVLDRDAVASAEAGGATLAQRVDVGDLSAAGWKVGAWAPGPNGSASLTISKRFAEPKAMRGVIAELSGAQGPLRAFSLSRHRGLLRTSYHLRGDADLGAATSGVTADRALVERLTAQRVDPTVLDERLTAQLRGSVALVVTVALPGGRHTVRVAPGQRAAIDARTSPIDTTRVALDVAGALFVVVALALLLGRRPRRRRDRPACDETPG